MSLSFPEYSGLDRMIEGIEANAREKQRQYDLLKKQHDDFDTRKIALLESKKAKDMERHHSLDFETKKLEENLKSLNDGLEILNQKVANARAEKSLKRQELEKILNDIKNEKPQYDSLVTQHKTLKVELPKLRSKVTDLENSMKTERAKEASLNKLKDDKAKLDKDLEDLKAEVVAQSMLHQDLRDDLFSTLAYNEEAFKVLQQTRIEVKGLTGRLIQFKSDAGKNPYSFFQGGQSAPSVPGRDYVGSVLTMSQFNNNASEPMDLGRVPTPEGMASKSQLRPEDQILMRPVDFCASSGEDDASETNAQPRYRPRRLPLSEQVKSSFGQKVVPKPNVDLTKKKGPVPLSQMLSGGRKSSQSSQSADEADSTATASALLPSTAVAPEMNIGAVQKILNELEKSKKTVENLGLVKSPTPVRHPLPQLGLRSRLLSSSSDFTIEADEVDLTTDDEDMQSEGACAPAPVAKVQPKPKLMLTNPLFKYNPNMSAEEERERDDRIDFMMRGTDGGKFRIRPEWEGDTMAAYNASFELSEIDRIQWQASQFDVTALKCWPEYADMIEKHVGKVRSARTKGIYSQWEEDGFLPQGIERMAMIAGTEEESQDFVFVVAKEKVNPYTQTGEMDFNWRSIREISPNVERNIINILYLEDGVGRHDRLTSPKFTRHLYIRIDDKTGRRTLENPETFMRGLSRDEKARLDNRNPLIYRRDRSLIQANLDDVFHEAQKQMCCKAFGKEESELGPHFDSDFYHAKLHHMILEG
jgi:hypothetical protein